MGLHEVQDRIRKRKKKRRRRVMIFFLIILVVSFGIFLTNAPYFAIKNIRIAGNEKIASELIQSEGDKLLGENIFLFSSDEMEKSIGNHPYLEAVSLTRKFPSTLNVAVTEKKAEVNYLKDGIISLLTREGILLESGANSVDGVTLIDTVELPMLGENIYGELPDKAKVIEEFRYLQERNISDVNFTEIDLTDMKNIRTFYNDLEIRLGYSDSMKQKLNAAINIISEGNLKSVKGYVDLSFVDEPVVFDEAMLEGPAEDDESSENGDG